MQLKYILFFIVLLCIPPQTQAQVYETIEVVKQKYVGLETYQYAINQPHKGFAILNHNFDLILADGTKFRRRKAIYFEQFRGNEICYRWEVRVKTEAEMEFYQTDFDEKFEKSGWKEWEKKTLISWIYYWIREQ